MLHIPEGAILGVGAASLVDASISVGAIVATAVVVVGALASAVTLGEWLGRRWRKPAVQLAGEPERLAMVLLPTRLPLLVDRTDVLRDATAGIRAGRRVLAFEGAPGVGKSAAATELAHRLRLGKPDVTPEFAECDFLWVDCREREQPLPGICQTVALLTGDQSVSAVAGVSKLDALRGHLARRRTVLLLDNVKIASDSLHDPIRDLLRTVPTGSLVIASVNGSHALEAASRVVLDELGTDDARELIQHEARRLGFPHLEMFDAEFADRLHAAIGGNPKLIESFLQSVASSPDPIENLIAASERGEGLAELFGDTWRELSPDAQSVLAACAFLRGQGVAEQLRVASHLAVESISEALAELIKVGLISVVRGVGRPEVYTCSLAVQRYTLTKAPNEQKVFFAKQLSAFYVRQLTSEPENASWAVPHIAGIKTVLQSLSDNDDDAGVQELFASVLDVLFTLGLFDDRIVTGRVAYESAIRANNHRAASLASDVLSSTYAARGEHEEAREALALGLLAAERSNDPGERARQMRAHGLTLYKAGDAAAALQAMEGADALARQTGDLEIVANLSGVRTIARWYLGDVDGARAAAEEALKVCGEMSWRRATAYALRNLAELEAHCGDKAAAETLLDQALDVAVSHDDRRQTTRIHLTTARLALFTGQLRECYQEITEAERAARSLGLSPELRELGALRRAANRARWLPPFRVFYAKRRPLRFSDAPVG